MDAPHQEAVINTMRAPGHEARHRHRRWLIVAAIIVAALTVYGAGLGWVAKRLQHDLAASIRPLPVQDDSHRGD